MLLQRFQTYFKQQFPNLSSKNTKLLLAVSGGVDSVVLTDLVAKAGFDFAIAHCNFQLRGEESERDETFVTSLAKKYNKEIFVKKFDTKAFAAEHKFSIQEAARELRYAWFREVANQPISQSTTQLINQPTTQLINQPTTQLINQSITQPINHSTTQPIATAHHANDNIETLLINFFRGTGISGLHGILPKQENIIRPLLFAKREEILFYANENNLSWVEDSSNTSDKYTRNLFRLQLIPAIKKIFPQVEDNLLHNIKRFSETEILYRQAIELHKKKLIEQRGNEFHIPVLKLQKATPLTSIIWEIIKNFGFTAAQIEEVKKLFDAENGSYVASASHRIIRNRNWLIIAPLATQQSQHILIEEGQKKVVFENGIFVVEELAIANCQLSTDKAVATLDAKKIEYPLLLRKWKQGDYFYPLGMQKKKKLGKFFIDIKLSGTQKEKIWVLEADKKIIWVIGYRIDDRFKITDNTKNVLKISWKAEL